MRMGLVLALAIANLALSACSETEPSIADTKKVVMESETTAPLAAAPVVRVELDKVIGFNDVEYCVPGAEFEKLLNGLLPTGPLGELIEPYQPVFPADYAGAFAKPDVTKDGYTSNANVAVLGSWQKLPVSNLAVWQTQESDYRGFTISFDAPFEEVLQTLNNLGFKLPASGKREAGEELVSYIRLESKAGKTTLTCSS